MKQPTFVTVSWLPFRARAMTLYPFIFVRRDLQHDYCLYLHELYHWRQQRKWWLIPWLLAYLILLPTVIGKPMSAHPLERGAYKAQRGCEADHRFAPY